MDNNTVISRQYIANEKVFLKIFKDYPYREYRGIYEFSLKSKEENAEFWDLVHKTRYLWGKSWHWDL